MFSTRQGFTSHLYKQHMHLPYGDQSLLFFHVLFSFLSGFKKRKQ